MPQTISPAQHATALIEVRGMWCTSCANAVERVLKRQPGVVEAAVSFAAESARVAWQPGETTLERLAAAIRKLGYEPVPEADAAGRADHIAAELKRLRVRHPDA